MYDVLLFNVTGDSAFFAKPDILHIVVRMATIHLCFPAPYTCYSVVYHEFSPWKNLSLWHYFMLPLEKIKFLTLGFLFLSISNSSQMQYPQFVTWSFHTVVFLPIFIFWICYFTMCPYVVIAVTGCCNEFFFALFGRVSIT